MVTSLSSLHTNEEENSRKERMFLRAKKVTGCVSTRPSCTLGPGPWGAVNWRGQGGAWRGSKVTQRDRGQLNLAGGAGQLAACVPRFLLCGKRGSLSGGGEQCPQSPEGSCIWKWSRKADVNRSSPLCRRSLRSRVGFGQHSGFFQRDDFESQLYSDRFLILGRPS